MSTESFHYREHGPAQPPAYGGPPSLQLLVTPEQRDRAERYLAEAYADGRLNEFEFDGRLELVMQASTRRDLNQAFYGLVDVPVSKQALGLHPAYQPSLVDHSAQGKSSRAGAAIAHFSAFFTWMFGPLLMYMIASKGSYAKQQAAQAFNFQVLSGVGFIAAGVVTSFIDVGWIMGLMWVAWFVLTLVGGVKASQGERWTNPVVKVSPWKPLSDR